MRLVLSALATAVAAFAPAAAQMVEPAPVLMRPSLPERLPVPSWVHSRRDVALHVRSLFALLDANRDRAITRDEFERGRERYERQFALLHRNHDWRRNREGPMLVELATLGGPMFDMADVNRDGRVSLREGTAIAYRHFDKMDVDRDGKISREERSQRSETTRRPPRIAAIPPGSEPATAAELRSIAEANRGFGLALYRRLAKEPGNVFISPISLAGAFGPAAAGARGVTRAAIGKVLGFPADDSALHPQLGGLLHSLESNSAGARVNIANALWIAQGFPVKRSFVDVASRDYDAEVANLDFRNGAAAAAQINQWVNRETKGRIPTLIEPDSLDEMTALVITNAVHFLGDWTVPFNASNTRPQPFHLAGGATRDVPMMYGKRRIRYAEAGPVQMIDLRYKGERLSMSVILPKERGGLAAVEAQLNNERIGTWLAQLDSGEPREVRVHLPQVKVEASYQLVEPLEQMGMAIAFKPHEANFRGIADTDLFISQVVHKTFLRIDEKGTEAAAATGIEVEVTSVPLVPPPTFRADHPFLLLIRDKTTGAVLFLGRIAEPERT